MKAQFRKKQQNGCNLDDMLSLGGRGSGKGQMQPKRKELGGIMMEVDKKMKEMRPTC